MDSALIGWPLQIFSQLGYITGHLQLKTCRQGPLDGSNTLSIFATPNVGLQFTESLSLHMYLFQPATTSLDKGRYQFKSRFQIPTDTCQVLPQELSQPVASQRLHASSFLPIGQRAVRVYFLQAPAFSAFDSSRGFLIST